jgi:hypothetical protein
LYQVLTQVTSLLCLACMPSHVTAMHVSYAASVALPRAEHWAAAWSTGSITLGDVAVSGDAVLSVAGPLMLRAIHVVSV